MPYPKPDKASLRTKPATNRAELAHKLATDIAEFVETRGLHYEAISDVRGAALAALNEFERRVAEPYEQSKIEGGGADPFAGLEREAAEGLISARHSAVIRQLQR